MKKLLIIFLLIFNFLQAEIKPITEKTVNKVINNIENIISKYDEKVPLKEFLKKQTEVYNKKISKQPKKEIRLDNYFVLKETFANKLDLVFLFNLKMNGIKSMNERFFTEQLLSKEGLSERLKRKYFLSIASMVCNNEKTNKLMSMGVEYNYIFRKWNKNKIEFMYVFNKDICKKYWKNYINLESEKMNDYIIVKQSEQEKTKEFKKQQKHLKTIKKDKKLINN